jgi:hypothetical protein
VPDDFRLESQTGNLLAQVRDQNKKKDCYMQSFSLAADKKKYFSICEKYVSHSTQPKELVYRHVCAKDVICFYLDRGI